MRALDGESPPQEAKAAAVMLLLFCKDNEPHVVYMQRTEGVGLKHSGQISFPGGRVEAQDENLVAAALRETHEEVGVSPDIVNVIGKLTPLYVPVSNFLVHPFVGWLEAEPDFVAEPREVADIMVVSLAHLQNPANRGFTDLEVTQDMRIENLPYYDLFGRVLWGATAMITSELLEIHAGEFS